MGGNKEQELELNTICLFQPSEKARKKTLSLKLPRCNTIKL